MANTLIKLINEGLDENQQPFNAIYGDATLTSDYYTIGTYVIFKYNIANLVVDTLTLSERKGLLIIP